MDQEIILTIEELQTTVKINKSMPFSILEPYLDDAYYKYLVPYVGQELLKKISTPGNAMEIALKIIASRVLGPMAVAMASPELGIQIGDGGHTVTRNDKLTVANDTKIAAAEENMKERGFANLERMLSFLEKHVSDFPLWNTSDYYVNYSVGHFLNSAYEFQTYGHININFSRLTFEQFRPVIEIYEKKLKVWIGTSLFASLQSEILSPADSVKTELVNMIREWIAMNVAGMFTSQTTRQQRSASGTVEFRPFIYPLYSDKENNGNFYADQVDSLESQINEYLSDHADDLGIDAPDSTDFNTIDKHIFAI